MQKVTFIELMKFEYNLKCPALLSLPITLTYRGPLVKFIRHSWSEYFNHVSQPF